MPRASRPPARVPPLRLPLPAASAAGSAACPRRRRPKRQGGRTAACTPAWRPRALLPLPRCQPLVMWKALLALLTVLLSALWWMTKPGPCSTATDEGEQVKFLLNLLVESRWSGLVYKLLYRRRHCRALTSAAGPSTAGRTADASVRDLPMPASPLAHQPLPINELETLGQPVEQPEIPQAAGIPLCPECKNPMVRRRNRSNHGLLWGCMAYPTCRGTRRPWGTGDGQRRP